MSVTFMCAIFFLPSAFFPLLLRIDPFLIQYILTSGKSCYGGLRQESPVGAESTQERPKKQEALVSSSSLQRLPQTTWACLGEASGSPLNLAVLLHGHCLVACSKGHHLHCLPAKHAPLTSKTRKSKQT